MNSKYTELRRKHERLIYHDYGISGGTIYFNFSVSGSGSDDEFFFSPKWTFDFDTKGADIELLAFNLGMAELISYWKCVCPPIVEVRCGALDEWQINWWKKLYRNGLGEFFYRNSIEADDDFMQIYATGEKLRPPGKLDLSGCLIPVGGGKDSVVTLELLRAQKETGVCYIAGNIQSALDCAKTAGYADSQIIKVSRTIDPALLELNKRGYLNGHTPFSSVIAFSSLIFACLSGKKYIVLSNESSANEGNTSTGVNHQYSKSIDFERDFREYTVKTGAGLPEYFSFLRPLSEWQITKKFIEFPQYLSVFQSCNVGSKTNTWCCKCAKCLYVYIMLSAFLNDEKLTAVFNENLLNNPELETIFNGLAYESEVKPFECVGTRAEINLALSEALRKRENLPFLLQKYAENPRETPAPLDGYFDENNFVPDEFLRLLRLKQNTT
ncbi:MAG: hypothetical protein LBC82_04505 [Oscillospiraceae bacterium]|jgi:hypothetical protein|nr:hypothetical protein [Oscillospiraceae bacterium]